MPIPSQQNIEIDILGNAVMRLFSITLMITNFTFEDSRCQAQVNKVSKSTSWAAAVGGCNTQTRYLNNSDFIIYFF
jgi:hypothetical protein